MELLLYLYCGAGLMFAAFLFLMNAESHGIIWDILWIVFVAAIWPLLLFVLIKEG